MFNFNILTLMKRKFSILIMLLAASALVFTSCKKDDEDDPPAEFIADAASFANYDAWTFITEKQGPGPSLGMAHQGNNEDAVRKVFQKENSSRSDNGQYPVGTIFFKETKDGDGNIIEMTGMAKRGNEFDPDHNNWEWFMLNPENGQIADRGLFDGMCWGCHLSASNTDYVFTK
jgi:hypothetical protein